jgi:hypothetical protein
VTVGDVQAIETAPRPRRHPLLGALWRIWQGLHALHARPDAVVDAELRRLITNDDQWRLLARLTPFDRAHHLRVHQLLCERGCTDVDVLLAALLHDVGKADGHARAHVGHRTLKVLLQRVAPRLLQRLTLRPQHWVLHGLYLSCHHPRLGAELAAAAGASERCCALIARHEEQGSRTESTESTESTEGSESVELADPGLAALIAADEAAIR